MKKKPSSKSRLIGLVVTLASCGSGTGDQKGTDEGTDSATDIDVDTDVDVDADSDTDTCGGAPPVLWEWAVGLGSNETDYIFDIALVDNGIVVTGTFHGASITIGSDQLNASGGENMFVARYDGQGNPVWAKTVTVDEYAWGYGLAIGSTGTIYVAGSFRTTLEMDGTILNSNGFGDAYLLALDPDGNLIDATAFGGGDHNERGDDVAVTSQGLVCLSGEFYSDAVDFGGTILSNTGTADAFVACMNQDLDVVWADNPTGSVGERASRIVRGIGGEIGVIGHFSSNPLTFDDIDLPNAGSSDLFWAKYDGSGNVVWARGAGGVSMELDGDLIIDSGGNFYLTGNYGSNEIHFADIVLTLHNPGAWSNDMFLAKYDSLGNALWAIDSLQATSEASGRSVTVDGADQVYATGSFYDSATFGDHELVSNGEHDLYLLKLDPDGNVLWAVSAGGEQGDAIFAAPLTVAADGAIFLASSFRSSQITLGTTTLVNQGAFDDLFLAKLSQNQCYR